MPVPADAGERPSSEVNRLIGLAQSRTFRDDDPCRPRVLPRGARKPAVTDAEPSATFTSLFSIYRRPATDAELEAFDDRDSPSGLEMPWAEEVYRRGVRIVRSHNGDEFTIRIASRVRRHAPYDAATFERCAKAVRDRLDDFDRPRSVVRAARRILVAQQERERRYLAETPEVSEGLSLTHRARGSRGTGGTGGPFDPEHFRTHGIMMSSGGGPPGGRRIPFAALVPDGVASIAVTSGGRTVTAAVRQNVVAVRIPRGTGRRFFPQRVVWRAADGSTVRVVRTGA